MINVKNFIQQVKIPLQQQWGYIYGTWGRMWTAELQKTWSKPTKTNWQKTKQYGSKWIGKMVTDCSGLVRRACYNLGQEVAHHSHYLYTDYCKNKGNLKNGLRADGTLPREGSLVFLTNAAGRKHHVGTYVGDDTVIQAKGTQWGVVTSNLAHWDAWGELKCIDYNNNTTTQQEPITHIVTNSHHVLISNPGAWLNLRQGPSKNQKVIAKMAKGTTAQLLEKTNNDWWKLSYNGHIGYAVSEYLKEI